ncbi:MULTISPECIES: nitroreductase family protein [unclassified Hahella]|uniref:nitroreductase family protein n=1 Tax=unclassified Hahella TaxID=2624107 RepID=UPI001C1E9AF7|nr:MULTISPECIES: nitroreductase family protein [unclassified Hahella]MBU6950860.1 nitroreductase family protein [Hahella sp. HN01]MDG9667246.1 nitroreductase family protein [Hahella sp. CR1]
MLFIEGEYETIEDWVADADTGYFKRTKPGSQRQDAAVLSKLLRKRKAYKRFHADCVIPETDVEYILQQASLSPSAFNIQHWRVIRVRRQALRNEILKAAWNQKQISEAAEILVVCADKKAWATPGMPFCHSRNPQDRAAFANMLRSIYANNPALERDEAMRSANLFAMSVMLIAESLDYQSCPMSGFNYKRVSELLHLDEDRVEIAMILTIGKGVSQPGTGKRRIPAARFTHEDKYRD